MKKIFFLILLFTTSCTTNPHKSDFSFSKDMNMNEFKIKLQEYAKNKLLKNNFKPSHVKYNLGCNL